VQKIQPVPAEQNKQEAKREFIELLKMALVFLLVFWVMKTFVIEGYEVQGESMFPTLEDRDRILVFKLPHELSKITLFGFIQPFDDSDIIVFEGEGNKRYVKRVIAHNPRLSGNRVNAKLMDDAADSEPIVKVEYDRGVVRVNNWQIDETQYLP
jgi:signal peptidase I